MSKKDENMDSEFRAKLEEITLDILEQADTLAALGIKVKAVIKKMKVLPLKAVDISDLKRIEKWFKQVKEAMMHALYCEKLHSPEEWEMLKHLDATDFVESKMRKESKQSLRKIWASRPIELRPPAKKKEKK